MVGVDLSADLLALGRSEESDGFAYVSGDACSTDWWDGVHLDGAV